VKNSYEILIRLIFELLRNYNYFKKKMGCTNSQQEESSLGEQFAAA
jgi:hypothetical protein